MYGYVNGSGQKNGNRKLKKVESGTLPEVDGEKGIDQDS